MKIWIAFLLINTVWAEVSREVFIRGKVGNEFDENKVKIIDSLGQSYFLPRSLFPKDFNFKAGESFSLEVDQKEIQNIKLLKK